jgi:hypothetical protein
MREARVVGFMFNRSAAPPGPNSLPPLCFSAASMLSRSRSFQPSRVRRGLASTRLGGTEGGIRRKVEMQWTALGENGRPFDCVLKFTDIAWPVVGGQLIGLCLGKAWHRMIELLGGQADEVRCQGCDVFAAFSQGRDLDGKDDKSVRSCSPSSSLTPTSSLFGSIRSSVTYRRRRPKDFVPRSIHSAARIGFGARPVARRNVERRATRSGSRVNAVNCWPGRMKRSSQRPPNLARRRTLFV